MPSLQESTQPEADYVNTHVLNDIIKEEKLERPKSVAEISQKENVCNITIKAEEGGKKAKRSASTVSTSTKIVAKPSDKASRLLGIDEKQVLYWPFFNVH